MSATLVSISDEQSTPHVRETRLIEKLSEAFRAVRAEFDTYDDVQVLRGLFNDYCVAQGRLREYWERRARKTERLLRDLLDINLTPEQRASVLLALHVDRRRDRSLLSTYEQRLVAWYRSMDAAGAQMIRTLFDRLAATSQVSDTLQASTSNVRVTGCLPAADAPLRLAMEGEA